MSFCATVFWNWPKKLYPVTRFDRSNGRFQTDLVFGDILLVKKWGMFDDFKVFLLLGSLSTSRVLQSYLCPIASPLYSKSVLKSLKILKMTFVETIYKSVLRVSKGPSTLTEGSLKKTKLDVIRCRRSPKMCRKSGFEF